MAVAVNPAGGRVVELDGLNVGPPGVRQRQIAAVAAGDTPALAVSPDGATIFAGTGQGVLALDAGTLAVRATGLAGQAVTALVVAPDGGSVFAVTGSRLVRLDQGSLRVT